MLLEAQFYMQELERRDSERISKRDLRLELIVIALIGLEIVVAVLGTVYGVREGNEQANTLEKVSRAVQRQASALSDVSVSIYYQKNAIVVRNVGQRDLVIVRYGFSPCRSWKPKAPQVIERGTFSLKDGWIKEYLGLSLR